MAVIVKAQIEQRVWAIRRRSLLSGRQRCDLGGHFKGQTPPRGVPAAGLPGDEVEESMIQLAHRLAHFDRYMGLSGPASDVCILHTIRLKVDQSIALILRGLAHS
jgi:hypothetical protein